MIRGLLFVLLLILVGAGIAAYFSIFIINEKQQAIVLQFGEPKKVIRNPGLYWKIPIAQSVVVFDKRILDIDTDPQEVIAVDQKRLVVDSFARYRIIDPLLFLQTVRQEAYVDSRIGTILDSTLRSVLGSASFVDIVRNKRGELMESITNQLNTKAKSFGVEIVDVRIRRADLPAANSEAIYARMRTEREREAAEIRAQGEEKSRSIKAGADRRVTVIKAEATRDSEKIRGDGDAERNRIFAEAFSKDPDFFAFYRSMQAYQEGLNSQDTRLVISPDSAFFRYFNNPSGAEAPKQ